jgi:hypothetical protein
MDIGWAWLIVGGAVNALLAWRLLSLIRRTRVLDALLQKVCVEAFAMRHRPIWLAWTAVMGDISVEVNVTRDLKRGSHD